MKYFVIFSLVIASGCIFPKTQTFPINYQFNDLPQESKIELRYENNTEKTVCLLPEMWPNSKGEIHFGGEFMFLIIKGKNIQ